MTPGYGQILGHYAMQCYFRQRWYDKRLQFNLDNITEITLSQRFLKKIWRPNTYFHNGKKSHPHLITVPNFFVRLRNDGQIYLSRRLTIQAHCPMNLVNYPMDSPQCPLIIGSYGYTNKEILYEWSEGNHEKSVELNKYLRMAQFELGKIYVWNETLDTFKGTFSLLNIAFSFKRYIGYYVLNFYMPSYLTVALSQLSFWINRDATPARVLLGVTTILSITTINITVRVGLPGVPYATALDLFFIICFGYVFASLVEFASVHFYTKVQQPDIKGHPDSEDTRRRLFFKNENGKDRSTLLLDGQPKGPTEEDPIIRKRRWSTTWGHAFWQCIVGNQDYRKKKLRLDDGNEDGNSVSKIDIVSRFLFPISFIVLNLLYWTIYTENSQKNVHPGL